MSKDVRVESWAELHEAVFAGAWNQQLRRFRSNAAFRGLSSSEFDLSTSLARKGEHYVRLETHLLRNFRKYAHGALEETRSDLFWLAVGQHHGLPSRLLDWTFSPFVAAHFTTDNLDYADHDGAIWSVDYVKVREHLPSPLRIRIEREHGMSVFTVDLLEELAPTLQELEEFKMDGQDFLVFLEPPSLDERIVNQLSLFSMMSSGAAKLDAWLADHSDVAHRIVISADAKWEIRDKLDEIGITERVLFPGLDGLAAWLRRYYGPGPT